MIKLLSPFVTTNNDLYGTTSSYGGNLGPINSVPYEIQTRDSMAHITGQMITIMQYFGYIIGAAIFVVAIILLIKAIVDRIKLTSEVSENSIKAIKNTALILLILNILTVCSNFVMTIISIVSFVFANNAKKLLANNIELASKKAKTASILNIIITALMLISPIIIALGTTVLKVVWDTAAML